VRSRGGGEELVGLTRHGTGSKIEVLVDKDSMPLMFQLKSANPNEPTITHSLLADVDELRDIVVADKAYDYDFLRDAFAERGAKLLSPHRVTRSKPPRDQEHIGRHYKRRWAVERLFSWLAPHTRNEPSTTGNRSASASASSTPAAVLAMTSGRRMAPAVGHYCDRCRRFARSSAAWARSLLKPISESESPSTTGGGY
jgi:transposase